MKLTEYLQLKGVRPKQFADLIGVSAAFVSRLLDGSRKPGGALALKIEEVTEGAVTLRDFHDSAPVAHGKGVDRPSSQPECESAAAPERRVAAGGR